MNSDYLDELSQKSLDNPVLIGFNIKDSESYTNACKYANGAIIGSAFIRAINQRWTNNIKQWIR